MVKLDVLKTLLAERGQSVAELSPSDRALAAIIRNDMS